MSFTNHSSDGRPADAPEPPSSADVAGQKVLAGQIKASIARAAELEDAIKAARDGTKPAAEALAKEKERLIELILAFNNNEVGEDNRTQWLAHKERGVKARVSLKREKAPSAKEKAERAKKLAKRNPEVVDILGKVNEKVPCSVYQLNLKRERAPKGEKEEEAEASS